MEKEEIIRRVEAYRTEIVRRLGLLVSIPSVRGEAEENAPFGREPARALDTALELLKQDGFKTVNLDHYAGYAELGRGEEVIGVIGHLDVVPASREDGWHSDPFTMKQEGDTLYGRGVSDDKGAVAASMIALKVLKDAGVDCSKRIRLIMGTNEESGSRGLQYYVEKEGHVDYGFTPDGDFPGVYGEKGMIGAVYRSKSTSLLDVEGGQARNIVCAKVTAKVAKNTYSGKLLRDYFNNRDIAFEIEEGNAADVLTVYGRAAHASTPEMGVNAISQLFTGLHAAGMQDPFVDFYCSHFGLETNGASLGAALSDEYGSLTLNCGMITMKDGVIEGSIDIRFPVTMTSRQVLKAMEGHLEDEGGKIEIIDTVEPLFFAPDSPLVTSLAQAYVEMTGDQEHTPMTIGGGTYAKEIHNTIAFGCAFPERDYHIHNADEWVTVDELVQQAEIYVLALLKLLEL
jgi:succinyl-diaminopimelate desuccinylase